MQRGRTQKQAVVQSARPTDTDDILKTKARMVALAHYLLRNGRVYQFAKEYLDADFKIEPNASDIIFKMGILTTITIALPYLYANYVMSYPCKVQHMHEALSVEQLMAHNTTMKFTAQEGCHVENMLRTPYSLLIGPIAAITFWTFIAGTLLWDSCLVVRHGFMLRQWLRSLIHTLCHDKIVALKFHTWPENNSQMVFSFVGALYLMVLVEMLAVGIILGSPISCVVGYAIAELLTRLANFIVSPPSENIAQINGELACWPYATPELFMRLASVPGPCTYIAQADLDAIYNNLPELRDEALRVKAHCIFLQTDLDEHEDIFSWKYYSLQKVYIPEMNITVDIADDNGSSSQSRLMSSIG